MKLHFDCFETPLGALVAAVEADGALVRLEFVDAVAADPVAAFVAALVERGHAPMASRSRLATVRREVREFLSGKRERFDLVLRPSGTAFQQAVWAVVLRVAYGSTLTYPELAKRVRRPTAIRAVARANAGNPIALAIPCHRIVGSDGHLLGYGGGVPRKAALLRFESRTEKARLAGLLAEEHDADARTRLSAVESAASGRDPVSASRAPGRVAARRTRSAR